MDRSSFFVTLTPCLSLASPGVYVMADYWDVFANTWGLRGFKNEELVSSFKDREKGTKKGVIEED